MLVWCGSLYSIVVMTTSDRCVMDRGSVGGVHKLTHRGGVVYKKCIFQKVGVSSFVHVRGSSKMRLYLKNQSVLITFPIPLLAIRICS